MDIKKRSILDRIRGHVIIAASEVQRVAEIVAEDVVSVTQDLAERVMDYRDERYVRRIERLLDKLEKRDNMR